MCLSMVLVIKCSLFSKGLRSRSSYPLGGSVAKAKEAKLSMIILIQSIWMAVRTDCLITIAEMTEIAQATMLAVSWNCKNFLIDS